MVVIVHMEQDTNMGIGVAVSGEPERVCWRRLSAGPRTQLLLRFSGSMDLLGQGNPPLHKQSQRWCLLMATWEHPSSAQEVLRIEVISTASFPHWHSSLLKSTQTFDPHSSHSSNLIQMLGMSHFKTR